MSLSAIDIFLLDYYDHRSIEELLSEYHQDLTGPDYRERLNWLCKNGYLTIGAPEEALHHLTVPVLKDILRNQKVNVPPPIEAGVRSQSEYLIDTEESIFLNYNECLPGVWNVLGIVDESSHQNQVNQGNPLSVLSKAMFDMSQLFLTDESKATIIPLLIYRELNVD